jgi:hypothetical protein
MYEELGRKWFKEEFGPERPKKTTKIVWSLTAGRLSLQAISTERLSYVDLFFFTVIGLLFCLWANTTQSVFKLGYKLDCRGTVVRFPAGAIHFFSSPWCPHQLWLPPSLIYNANGGVVSPWVKQQVCEADHSVSSGVRLRMMDLYLKSPYFFTGGVWLIKLWDNSTFTLTVRALFYELIPNNPLISVRYLHHCKFGLKPWDSSLIIIT